MVPPSPRPEVLLHRRLVAELAVARECHVEGARAEARREAQLLEQLVVHEHELSVRPAAQRSAAGQGSSLRGGHAQPTLDRKFQSELYLSRF